MFLPNHFFQMLLLCALLVGCSAKAESRRLVPIAELSDSTLSETGTWQSTTWANAAWLKFEGKAILEIEHALGHEPSLVQVYLSFDEQGQPSVLAAGDMARIVGVSSQTVTVQNSTEADYYLRVVLF